jgi:alkylation response protein AidB-like acyl-CoA dehydrogenase
MDFGLSKPQRLLQSSVRDLLARACPLERTRELMATDTAHDPRLWRQLADLGWLAMNVPERCGGLALGAVDVAAAAEAMGAACMAGPWLTAVCAAELLSHCASAPCDELLGGIASGTAVVTLALLEERADWDPEAVSLPARAAGAEYEVHGAKLFVPDADVSAHLLCACRLDGDLAVIAVPRSAAGVRVIATPGIDLTRKLYRVDLDGVRVTADRLLARGVAARDAIDGAIRLGTVAACAELVGGMQWVTTTSVEYAKRRHQFDRPIGAFQAVQHMCADMLLYLESARSAAYAAAWAVAVGEADADRYVSVAKAWCSDAAREVGNLGVQVHGGMGFTWEHDLHLFYRRAKANEILFGDATFHRERLARLIVDAEPGRVAS